MSATKIPRLSFSELQKCLKRFGLSFRSGKGSEIVITGYVYGKAQTTSNFRRYRIGQHGSTKRTARRISGKIIEAILRRFKIKHEDFLTGSH